MKKSLSKMTIEELWQLFPVFLTPPNKEWKVWYGEEEKTLEESLPMKQIIRISHIGSTSIDRIWAKPIIDILLEISVDADFKTIKNNIIGSGYICMCESPGRASFNKGYTIDGFAGRVFHLHLRYSGDNDELYYRDYLIENPDIAKEYEILKLDLWKRYEHNRDAYTEAKTDMVKSYTEMAKEIFADRYGSL